MIKFTLSNLSKSGQCEDCMNKLILADNLEVLKSLPDNCIDAVITDPPFNTGRDFKEYNDNFGKDIKNYLDFMEPRLIEIHRVLSYTGSLYLHCDPTSSHYLKVMLDDIFNIYNFRNEIIWHYQDKFPTRTKTMDKNHDVILFYSRTNDYIFNKIIIEKDKPNKRALRKAVNGKATDIVDENGNKTYVEYKTKKADDVWVIPRTLSKKERNGYPTQKPLKLYQRLVKAATNQDALVLDPFMGSGTTIEASASLDRRFIGIEENPNAIKICEQRLDKYSMFCDYQFVQKWTN